MMLLTLKNIVAGYGNITALKGISLSVPEGKIVTLIGANGAGKSTTMKTIMGLMKPAEGEILFKDKSITGQKSFHIVNAGVVLVPEGRQILQNMTVRENLELGAYQRNQGRYGESVPAFSPAAGKGKPIWRHPFRRRTADARHCPCHDGKTAAHAS